MSFFFAWGQLAKARTLYIANNWIYTTNHKRIAVNYFWFVILSGIVGMVLATIIRLEMAYPGVGILAGDSLQYLTVVTAHAVVMVFFMIMPLLFGAFANFLIPTQLGVHDVAFPRLNSAAFWFLPAGFLMLCQLVCIDRRYQRMNCFNIREVQTLLRSKYQPSFLEILERHQLLEYTAIGLRFKLFDVNPLDSNMYLSFEHGIYNTPANRDIFYPLYTTTTFKHPLSILSQKVFDKIYSLLLDIITPFFGVNYSFNLNHFLSACSTSLNGLNWVVYPNMVNFMIFNNKSSDKSYFSYALNDVFLAHNNVSPRRDSEQESAFIYWFLLRCGDKMTYNPTFGVHYLPAPDTKLISYPLFNSIRDLLRVYISYLSLNTLKSLIFTLTSFWYQLWTCLDETLRTFSTMTNLLTPYLVINSLDSIFSPFFNKWFFVTNKYQSLEIYSNTKILFSSSVEDSIINSGEELSSNTRRLKSSSPVVGYSFKVGDFYPSNTITLYPSIIRSLSDVTRGVRRSTWFFNPMFSKLWKENFGNYMHRTHHTFDFPITAARLRPSSLSNNSSFYNFFFLVNSSRGFINQRWLSINSLDQKMYRMFMSASMQQKIYANWRNLKFHREGWRCRLLASRHQKTLYKRFNKEESLVWSVEKNAKDVLPGWAMITPFSGRVRYTAIGKVDLGLMGVFLVLNSSIVSSSNFLVTYRYLSTLNNRKMRDARSFFTEGIMVASWMMIAANPMLAIGILMLLSDRHW
jgi:hypothetical protein